MPNALTASTAASSFSSSTSFSIGYITELKLCSYTAGFNSSFCFYACLSMLAADASTVRSTALANILLKLGIAVSGLLITTFI
jgi:hypothetical protein